MAKKTPPPYEHQFTIGKSTITGRVVPLDVGFEVFVPVNGAETRFYDDNLDAALGEAQKRLDTAAREFAATEDPVRAVFGRDGEYGGTTFAITVTERKSGRFEFGCADYPNVHHAHADEEIGFAEFVGKLSMARDLADSQTVDGERAKVVHGTNGAASQQLPIRTATECAAEVHRCMAELSRKTSIADDAKRAQKAAESALSEANVALLDAVDREAKPALDLETTAA